MSSDDRVPGYLGRVLDAESRPVGTCFQVVPGVLVTAWHVLRDADVGNLGDEVRIEPLGGGDGFAARVENADQLRDLSVLRAESGLAKDVPGFAAADGTRLRTDVLVTGCADLRDSHQYQFLDAPGQWAGGTTRDDGVRLGRLTASGVMRGMSGAPVLADGAVVGVVRARYNTDDGWGRDTVWVARTEDLEPLLRDIGVEVSARGTAERDDPPAAGGVCPYPGLAAFDSRQSAWFFGRTDLTVRLLERLAVAEERGLPLIVVGVSGSGKSSLLHAGLQAALLRGDLSIPGSSAWPQIRLTPGSRPLTELVSHTAAVAGVPVGTSVGDVRETPARFAALVRQAAIAHARQRGQDVPGRVVLIIDQLEEVFTLCEDAAERAAFVAALRAAAHGVSGDETTPSALVIASLRTDFFSACAEEPGLAEILQDNQFLVGRMSPAELRSVVEGPAEAVGLHLEPGLVDRVIDDVVDASGHQPGTLPLLAYALEATWGKRRGNTMTLASYQEAGGVRGAISTAAENLFRSMDEEQRRILRRLLLALVAVGDGSDDTRRRVSKSELTGGGEQTGKQTETVLNRLVATRLVTVDRDTDGNGTVEIAHEALLGAWPRLTTWLSEDRTGLVVHRRLTDATSTWVRLERDDGSLYRGAQLADIRAWLDERGDRRASLTDLELEFVTASEIAEDATREAIRRNNQMLRRGVVALAALLVVAMVAGGLAIWQQRVADEERATAERQRTSAVSRLYAQESVAARDTDPRRSLLLAMASWQLAPTVEARGALLATQVVPYRGALDPGTARLVDTDLSPDGRTAALTTTTGSVTLWDTRSHRQIAEVTGADDEFPTVEFSPDGKVLGTTHVSDRPDHRLRLWDPRTGSPVRSLPVPENVVGLVFSEDGNRLATVSRDSPTIMVWDVSTGRRLKTLDKGGAASGVAFNHDGSLIAAGAGDNSVRLWRTDTGRQVAVFTGHEKLVTSVDFSPNGRLLSSSSADGTVRLWDVRDDGGPSIQVLRPTEEDELIMDAEFSPDGQQVVAGTNKGKGVQRWRVADGEALPAFFGHTNGVGSVDYRRDGRTVLSGSVDGSAILWQAQTNVIYQSHAPVAAAFSQDRRLLAFTRDNTVTLWDAVRRSFVRELKTGVVHSLSFSPDGTQLATAGADGSVRLWSTTSGRSGRPGTIGDDMVAYSVRFSPDGKTLTAHGGPSYDDLRSGTARMPARYVQLHWDLAEPIADPVRTTYQVRDVSTDPYPTGDTAYSPDGKLFAVPLSTDAVEVRRAGNGKLVDTIRSGHGSVTSVAFSNDGTVLATGGADRNLRLWKVSSRKQIGSTLSGHDGAISRMAFLPDGDTLVSVSQSDDSVRLWSLSAHRSVAAVPTLGNLNDLAVQPETGLVAVTGVYSQVDILEPDPDRVLADLCSVFRGTSLAEEWKSTGNDPDQAPRC
ncbi:trypsin-like peptidase domain-containing protein [Nocardioides sp. NPDC059952]|uniref:nSTAND1 domain-containing NTPase n=1 Tax=Nocardioides sp. NPDC059952 TaxID=3347014 RepID=UPI00364C93B5